MKSVLQSLRFGLMVTLFSGTIAAPLYAERQRETADQAVTFPAYKKQLLEIAFSGVSMMPLDPHVRNRSRAQYQIVSTALELSRPELALGYADQIMDWRRAASYADIAHFYAEQGHRDAAVPVLDKAERLLELSEQMRAGRLFPVGEQKVLLESMQEWRLDRVKAHVAKACIALEQTEKSKRWSEGISENETPGVVAYQAGRSGKDQFETTFLALKTLAETENFEAVKNALLGFADLYDTVYADEQQRKKTREAIDTYRAPMPRFMQIEILLELAQTAKDHADKLNCNTITHEADTLLDEAKFFPRMFFPLKSKVLALLYLSGEPEAAASMFDGLTKKYAESRAGIIDIYRAGIVCRIAETGAVIQGPEAAVAFYDTARQEGLVNPNSRPRADDLNEICCSMALASVQPSENLQRQLEELKNKLGDPW